MIEAKYTVVLKTLMDDENVKPLLDKALSTYPMYVPENETLYSIIPTREELNNKLLNHYKYREIGFETVGRFLDELQISMEEIMPFYYQLFKSEDIMNSVEDPFGNVDITETFQEEKEGTSKGTSKGSSTGTSSSENSSESTTTSETETDMTNNSKNVKSSTPQGILDIGTKNIGSVNYADEANWNEDVSSSSGNTTDHNQSSSNGSDSSETESQAESTGETQETTSHTFTKKGNQGVNTYAHDIQTQEVNTDATIII